MNLHRILRSVSPLMFILTAWLAGADRPCSPLPGRYWNFPDQITCYVTNYWTLEVDLDGDGVADLSRERFRAEHHYCMAGQDSTTSAEHPKRAGRGACGTRFGERSQREVKRHEPAMR